MTTAPSPTSKDAGTKEVLLEKLRDPSLTKREIERIQQKLELLEQHS